LTQGWKAAVIAAALYLRKVSIARVHESLVFSTNTRQVSHQSFEQAINLLQLLSVAHFYAPKKTAARIGLLVLQQAFRLLSEILKLFVERLKLLIDRFAPFQNYFELCNALFHLVVRRHID